MEVVEDGGRRTNGTTGLSIKEKKVKQWSKANTAAKVFYCFVFAVVSSSMFLRPSINKKRRGFVNVIVLNFFEEMQIKGSKWFLLQAILLKSVSNSRQILEKLTDVK